MIKICATADLHGYLPEVPPCDLFLLAGDVCPVWNHKLAFQEKWICQKLNPWLGAIEANHKVMVWGNHDWIGQCTSEWVCPVQYATVLTDESITLDGLTIWGSPWTLDFMNWAFNMPAHLLAQLHQQMPPCDIVLTHGPPFGLGDRCPDGRRVGSPELLHSIKRVQPKLVVSGHIHDDQGSWKVGDTIVTNVAHVGEDYLTKLPPQVFTLDLPRR